VVPFELIPKSRDENSKHFYKFMRWYARRHRQEIEQLLSAAMDKAIDEWLITGQWRLDEKALQKDVLRFAQMNFNPNREGFEKRQP